MRNVLMIMVRVGERKLENKGRVDETDRQKRSLYMLFIHSNVVMVYTTYSIYMLVVVLEELRIQGKTKPDKKNPLI